VSDSFKGLFILAAFLGVCIVALALLITGAAIILGEPIHFMAEKFLTILKDYSF